MRRERERIDARRDDGNDGLLGLPPSSIPAVAPPLPSFLTDDDELRPTRDLGLLKVNRQRAKVVKPKGKGNGRGSTGGGAQGRKKAEMYKSKDPAFVRRKSNKKRNKPSIVGTAIVPVVMKATGKELKIPVKLGKVNGEIKVIEKHDGVKVEVGVEECAEALRRNKGYLTYAAAELGINYKTLGRIVNGNEELKEIIEEERVKDLDEAEKELGEMRRGATVNKLGAVCFTLKCRGKDRGYVESNKFEVPPGMAVQINLVDFKESDIVNKKIIEIEDKREGGGENG